MKKEVLRIQNGVKYELEYPLLKDINLQADKGKIYGLLFDNVKEEKCILDIFRGKIKFDEGKLFLWEEKFPMESSDVQMKKHIYFLEFESTSSDELTVADSFFILEEGLRKFIKNKRKLTARIETVFEAFHISLSGNKKLSDLSQLERVQLELIKAYHQGYPFILIQDLAFSLNVSDFYKAKETIRMLIERGLTFFMIDHDETALIHHTDEIIIFRKGRTAFPLTKDKFSMENIARILMGTVPEKNMFLPDQGTSVLSFDGAAVGSLAPLSGQIGKGEITVFLDKDGYFGEELAGVLKGEKRLKQGNIYLNEVLWCPKNNEEAIRNGICVIEENPSLLHGQLFYNLSVLDNLILTLSAKHHGKLISKSQEQSIFREAEQYFTKERLLSKVSELSASDRQKLVYYKWYLYYPHVIVCVKPFSGVDYQMQHITEDFLKEYQKRGIGVIIITPNMWEAYSFGGKVIILKE